MNSITEHTNNYAEPGTTQRESGSRFRPLVEEVFGPVDATRGTLERRVLLARSGVAYFGLVTTLVQVVVWLVIGLMTNHLDSPWWLWTTVPAVAAVAALTAVQRWHRWWTPARSEQEEGR